MAKKSFQTDAPELDLTPFMNLVMVLIPGLLVQSEAVTFAVINVAAPTAGGRARAAQQEPQDEKPPLNLTVTVTKQGHYVAGSGGVLENVKSDTEAGPTVPLRGDGEHDYKRLQELIISIKDKRPDESKIIINLAPDVKYDVAIRTMDATRSTPDQSRVLFPDVAIGAGFVK